MTKSMIDLSAVDGLDNEKRVHLLSIIDQLRELGISGVSLPQVSHLCLCEYGTKIP